MKSKLRAALVPLGSKGHLAELFSCFNHLNTNQLDKQRGERRRACFLPPRHPSPLRTAGQISAADFPLLRSAPSGADTIRVPLRSRHLAPLEGPPRSERGLHFVGRERVLSEARRPLPPTPSWNPLHLAGSGRMTDTWPRQGARGGRAGEVERRRRDAAARAAQGRVGDGWWRVSAWARGEEEASQGVGGDLPATAAAARPSSGSRTAGSAAPGMTVGAGAQRRTSEMRGGQTPPTQRPAEGGGRAPAQPPARSSCALPAGPALQSNF